ncbi:MAG TPA: hypothetical protein VED40_23380 [Azospirillaceae bacterium]|nr:hypothetical protein [Azospirillaceae bacterium]
MADVQAPLGTVADGDMRIGALLAEIGRLRSEVSAMSAAMARMETALARARIFEPTVRPKDEPPHGAYRAKVVEVLKAAHPGRLTAAEVAERVAELLPVRVHPKTPGMTLTRLKRDGLVARDRRTWHWIPPTGSGT